MAQPTLPGDGGMPAEADDADQPTSDGAIELRPLDEETRAEIIAAAGRMLASARALAAAYDPAEYPLTAEGAASLLATVELLYLDAVELP